MGRCTLTTVNDNDQSSFFLIFLALEDAGITFLCILIVFFYFRQGKASLPN
jgi:hypothetical protein